MNMSRNPVSSFLTYLLAFTLAFSCWSFSSSEGAFADDSAPTPVVLTQKDVSAASELSSVEVSEIDLDKVSVPADFSFAPIGAFSLAFETGFEAGDSACGACSVSVSPAGLEADEVEALAVFPLEKNDEGDYAVGDKEIDSKISDEGALTFEADSIEAFAVVQPQVKDGEEAVDDRDPQTAEATLESDSFAAGATEEGDADKNAKIADRTAAMRSARAGVSLLAAGDVRNEPALVANPVDSRAEVGLQINLFDYSGTNLDSNFFIDTPYSYGMTGINVDNGNLRPFRFFTGGTSPSGVSDTNPPTNDTCSINSYTGGAHVANQGIVKNTLDANGYPVLNNAAGGSSLGYLFNESNVAGKKAYRGLTGLFQVDEDGYYRYNSNENYAYYGSGQPDGKFKLYNSTFNKSGSTDYRIGFFPFDEYAKTSDQVGPGEKNHQFGMTISGNFVYPPNGKINRNNQSKDMIFDFSGDDDVWVFIDGVLVLDIGGIHQPTHGKINFATGDVEIEGATACAGSSNTVGTKTTLKKIFEAAGKTWDSSSYSSHHMDFFYLERGGYDSNCQITMNIALVKPFDLVVEKEWSDGAAAHAADSVAVQLYYTDKEGNKHPYGTPVVLSKDNSWKTTFEKLPATDDSGNPYIFTVEEGTVDDQGVFTASNQLASANGYSYKLTKTDYANNNANVSDGFQVADPSNPANGSIKLTNTKQIPPTQLTVFKEDKDTKAALSDVEFELWADANGNGKLDEGDKLATAYSDADCKTAVAGALKTGADGKATFYGLMPGVYWIKETKAQSGYQKLDAPIRFEIGEDASKAYFHDAKTEVTIVNKAVSITVDNAKIQKLPAAGGIDKGPLLLLGMFLIVVSAFFLYRRKSENR